MRDYQKARKVVDDLDNPSNLAKAEYARENAEFAEQTIMDLELQMILRMDAQLMNAH